MPNFKYTALDQNGAEKTGFVTADNKIAAMEMVRAQGLLVRECEEAKGGATASATKKDKGKKEKGKGKKKDGGICLNWYDRIWSEIHVMSMCGFAVAFAALTISLNELWPAQDWLGMFLSDYADAQHYGVPNSLAAGLIILSMVGSAIFCLTSLVSLVKKLKAGQFWETSFIGGILLDKTLGRLLIPVFGKIWAPILAFFRFSLAHRGQPCPFVRLIIGADQEYPHFEHSHQTFFPDFGKYSPGVLPLFLEISNSAAKVGLMVCKSL
jgi:hypothetical protein